MGKAWEIWLFIEPGKLRKFLTLGKCGKLGNSGNMENCICQKNLYIREDFLSSASKLKLEIQEEPESRYKRQTRGDENQQEKQECPGDQGES